MIGYKDITFCVSPNCMCARKLTDEIRAAAVKWWGGENPPISVAYLCAESEKK